MAEAQQIQRGGEPVVLLAAVENDLQRRQPEGHGPEADIVDLAAPPLVGGAEIGRVFQEAWAIRIAAAPIGRLM